MPNSLRYKTIFNSGGGGRWKPLLDEREDKGMVLRVEDLKIIKYNESFSFRTVFDFAIKKETPKILV